MKKKILGSTYLAILTLSASIFTNTAAAAAKKNLPPLETVPSVDINRYAGLWYEVARLPNWFQKKCDGDVTAEYTLLDDGDIKVVNRCGKGSGKKAGVEGRAKRAAKDSSGAKLKVRFAPAILSFLPFVWGDYWIIDLADDYSHAVVGDPGRKYLWVLSRKPAMPDDKLDGILKKAEQKGYVLDGLIRTKQSGGR